MKHDQALNTTFTLALNGASAFVKKLIDGKNVLIYWQLCVVELAGFINYNSERKTSSSWAWGSVRVPNL